MNAKYLKPAPVAKPPIEFRKSGRLMNAAALFVIVASVIQTTTVMGMFPSNPFSARGCSVLLGVSAGQHSGAGECLK